MEEIHFQLVRNFRILNKYLFIDLFSLEFVKSSSVHVYRSVKFREIVQELNVRIKFIEYARASAEESIDEQGQTELHLAVKDNDITAVRELLSDDRNVNAQDSHGWTPLHIATNNTDSINIALLLLRVRKINFQFFSKIKTLQKSLIINFFVA